MKPVLRIFLPAAALLLGATGVHAAPKILLPDLPCREVAGEAVFFGFDQNAFPYHYRLQTRLMAGKFDSVAVPHGPPGAHDEFIRYYGAVIRIDGKFRMWYYGQSGPEPDSNGFGHGGHPNKALCYATSDDAVHWVKPKLGLVEFNGSKDNNIVALNDPGAVVSAAVLYDPEDPRPERRFKIVYESMRGGVRPSPCVAFSPDGLTWTPWPTPIGDFLEMQGITKFCGRYFVNGQSPGSGGFPRRKLLTLVSGDFEHWSPPAEGMNRSNDYNTPFLGTPLRESDNYEEIHLGAALWNRGNVLLGIYGQWHSTANGDRRLVTMDLGLTVTHDAIHHVEPIPGFKIIPSREQPGSAAFDMPALMQGQGMENVGDKTYYWYSFWKGNAATGVRLATWDRDRLGLLKPYHAGTINFPPPDHGFQAITCRFQVTPGDHADVFVNATGLGSQTRIRATLLDHTFKPIPGFTAVLQKSGLRIPVAWENNRKVDAALGETHLQLKFEGMRPEDGSLYAAYVVPVSP